MPQPILYISYSQLVKGLVDQGVPPGEIFDYIGTPCEQKFRSLLNTLQSFLYYYEEDLKIKPAKIYFTNHRTFNARAGFAYDHFLINFHSGIVVETFEFFRSKAEELSKWGLEILETNQPFKDPLSDLMGDFCVRFFFDHELAHLIQKSEPLNNLAEDEYPEGPEQIYSLEQHIKEFDSDFRGSVALASVIIDYWINLPEGTKTNASLSVLVSSGIASVLGSFTELIGIDEDFYMEKYKHPHPLVRVNYILNFLENIFNTSNVEKIDWKATLDNALVLTTKVLVSDETKFNKNFYLMNTNHQEEIRNYINNVLIANLHSYPYLGIYNANAFPTEAMNWQRFTEMISDDKFSGHQRINFNNLHEFFPEA
ncbi:hypothetical protein [Chitinophaga sp. MM2321]|uniref:hypothetical protein n=1 Tax=Chitinophaga sp. MM2321 TaxID=3137178 RepID=UPI0032D5ADD4